MTVTDSTPNANTSEPTGVSRWTSTYEPDNCWRSIVRHNKGRYSLQRVCCHRLDCETCGPNKRRVDYEEAVVRHALEDEIWAVYSRSDQVDRLRKKAGRADQPIESLPVADDWNLVLSPYRFEGAVQLSSDEISQAFMTHRVARRQHTRSGRWAPKKLQRKVEGETLSREYISPEAFKNVAVEIGAKVHHSGEDLWFDDASDRGPEQVKKMFLTEEYRLREARRRARGWKFWGGVWIRVAV